MKESAKSFLAEILIDLSSVNLEIVLLVMLVVFTVIVLDAVTLFISRGRDEFGVSKRAATIAVDGSSTLPVREYFSESQGLAGRPDALISEEGFIIPVERKPTAKKIRDRHVAQLLVYMRLIEEFEGKKPPYGYLIIGTKCRKFKIENTPGRQAWLQKLIDEMRAIKQGADAIPMPHPRKCAKCDVRAHCAYSYGGKDLSKASSGLKVIQ
ncbi:MAG: hypothetical protein DCC75_10595 [Proteobacteria bacterium]|nr:MAG: hypothetical protein DCC75_10595 [Pseudomonadota bacterium]